MSRFFQIICIISFFISSCRKENTLHPDIIELSAATEQNLHATEFLDEQTGFVAAGHRSESGMIYRTADAGQTWTPIDLEFSDWNVYDIIMVSDSLGYASTENGYFYRTTDGGDSWNIVWLPADQMPFHEANRPIGRSIEFVNDSLGFIVGGENYNVGLIHRTADGGANWTFDTLKHELRGIDMFDQQLGYVSGFGFIARTENGGESFDQLGITGDFYVAISALSSTEVVAAGQNGGVYRSTDQGDHWTTILKPNGSFGKRRFITDMLFIDSRRGFIIGDEGLLLTTVDGGNSWETLPSGIDGMLYDISYTAPYLYFSGSDGRLFRMTP